MTTAWTVVEHALPHWPACAIIALYLVGFVLAAFLTVLAVLLLIHDFMAGARKLWRQP